MENPRAYGKIMENHGKSKSLSKIMEKSQRIQEFIENHGKIMENPSDCGKLWENHGKSKSLYLVHHGLHEKYMPAMV